MANIGARPGPLRTVGSWSVAGMCCVTLMAALLAMRPAAPFVDTAPQVVAAKVHGTFYAGCGEQAVTEPATIPIW